MVNFCPLATEIGPVVLGTLQISTGFASSQRYYTALQYIGRQPNIAALNRGRRLYSVGRPARLALAHILVGISIHTTCLQSYAVLVVAVLHCVSNSSH